MDDFGTDTVFPGKKPLAEKNLMRNGNRCCRVGPWMFLVWLTLGLAPAWGNEAEDVSRALIYLREGRLDEAESSLLKARLMNPDDPRISYDLGIVQFRKRDYDSASSQFAKSARAEDPLLRANSLHNLGNSRFHRQDWGEAVKAYSQALEIREDPLTRFNLEQAEKRQQEEAKKEQYKKGQDQKGQDQDGKDQDGKEGKEGKEGKDQEGKDQQGKEKSGKGQDGKNGNSQSKPGEPDQKNASDSAAQNQNGNATDSKPAPQQDSIASGVASLPDSLGSGSVQMNEEDQQTRNLQMASQAMEMPKELSERAKSLKDLKVSRSKIEQILKQMEEREQQVQQRLRRNPQRQEDLDEMDPFFMTPEQLQKFYERRRGGNTDSQKDQPDW